MSTPSELPSGVSRRMTLTLPASGGKAFALSWSCDSRRLATVGYGGDVWDVDFRDWRHRHAFPTAPAEEYVLQVLWSPVDPDLLLQADHRGLRLLRVDPDGRGCAEVWKAPVPYESRLGIRPAVSFSPTGDRIVTADQTSSVRILSTATGRVVRTVTVGVGATFAAWSPADDDLILVGSDDGAAQLAGLSGEARGVLAGDIDGLRWVTWSPDGRYVCVTSRSSQVRVWDSEGQLRAILEGHTDTVLGARFSGDSGLLHTVSLDQTVRSWHTGTWQAVARIPLDAPPEVIGGLATAPTRPALARIAHGARLVEVYEMAAPAAVPASSRTYANAKVVLLGDSGVGKSGLGLVLTGQEFVPTESTHARQVWTFHEEDTGTGRREILLWDLAGQPGYRLIHQLHLDEVSAAVVVFDARSETDPFAGVRYWARALRQQAGGRTIPALLVAARTDRGGPPVSRRRIDALRDELGLGDYLETSAKDGKGVEELARAIRASIDWSELPPTASPGLFETIKEFLWAERAGERVLVTADDLYRTFRERHPSWPEDGLRASFDTCVHLLALRGIVRKVSFGGFVLLQPELLDAYASSLINRARAQPDGLGFLPEAEALAGEFLSDEERDRPEAEIRVLLNAMIEELLGHDVALREPTDGGVNLVFPSQLTIDRPEEPDSSAADVVFHFDGPVQSVYATLAVRLVHVSIYRRHEMWRNACTYQAAVGGVCGLRFREVEEGRGEITVFFTGGASEETRFVFEEYVRNHLQARALAGTVRRERVFACPSCGYLLPGDVVRLRQGRGLREAGCPVCDTPISLLDREERLAGDQILQMNATADAVRDRAAATARIRGKEEAGDYDVFLSYHSKDRAAVLEIARQLRREGVLPWLDQEDLVAGRPWRDQLEEQIGRVRAGAFFLGPNGRGQYQRFEEGALLGQVAKRRIPLIPVFLPGTPDEVELSMFLAELQAVDFRRPDSEPLERLLRAIRGDNVAAPFQARPRSGRMVSP